MLDILEIKLEIELPGRAALWHIAVAITEGNAKLNQTQQINIAP